MPGSEFKPGNPRLKEAIMEILANSSDLRDMGMKKLAKLLYFADFNHYHENFESITRETYERFDHGPMPTSLYEAIEQLEAEGYLSAEKNSITKEIDKWEFELGDDHLAEYLSEEERARLRGIVDKLGDLSANQLEKLSHRDTPWQVTDDRDDIDYRLVFYRDEDIEEIFE